MDDAWEMRRRWTLAVGWTPTDCSGRQVHGDGVSVATELDGKRGGRPDATEAPIADAIVSATPGLALMTLHADCVPILLADRHRRIVSAVHAGWRGTVVDVAGATVRRMVAELGADTEDIVAFIGPGIGVDTFEVGDEVVEAFRDRWPEMDVLEPAVSAGMSTSSGRMPGSSSAPAYPALHRDLRALHSGGSGPALLASCARPQDRPVRGHHRDRSRPGPAMIDRELGERIGSIRRRIDAAATTSGRSPSDVTLVAVSKTVDRATVMRPTRRVSGVRENRVPDARTKYAVPLPTTLGST
jgi:YfiH family protein